MSRERELKRNLEVELTHYRKKKNQKQESAGGTRITSEIQIKEGGKIEEFNLDAKSTFRVMVGKI